MRQNGNASTARAEAMQSVTNHCEVLANHGWIPYLNICATEQEDCVTEGNIGISWTDEAMNIIRLTFLQCHYK
jgi:hypothetical protein